MISAYTTVNTVEQMVEWLAMWQEALASDGQSPFMREVVGVLDKPDRDLKAMEMMLKHGIRRLPIIDRGRLVGIVTGRDLLRWVVKITYEGHTPFEIKEIFARPNLSKS